jgi:hypothetical protein
MEGLRPPPLTCEPGMDEGSGKRYRAEPGFETKMYHYENQAKMGSMEGVEKISVTPLPSGEFGEIKLHLPFALGDIRIDSVEGLLKADLFSVWRELISNDSIELFEHAKLAFVHVFQSAHVVGKDEEDSKDLLQKAFLCLRVVKPTRARFSAVQYRKTKNGGIDVFSVVWPALTRMNMPESEVLNHVNVRDIQELKLLWPPYSSVRESGPSHLRRATRYYETGYDALWDADLQFTTWLMGIEALYSDGDEPCTLNTIKSRIVESVGPNTDIYTEFEGRSLYAPNPVFVKDILDDMFELRDRFIHGAWTPKSWLDKPKRNAISGGLLNWPDVLREAASFILRTGIKKKLLSTTNGV